jgi:hypothetical protein
VTLERLAALCIRAIKRMSPAEKARMRKHLEKTMNRHNSVVLGFMAREGLPMTADYYCRCNFSLTWEEIKDGDYPEWRAEVERLIEDGELFDGADGEYRLAIPEAG